ncbi:hypothetical protein Tco_0041227 [Tanacetum coccineum]
MLAVPTPLTSPSRITSSPSPTPSLSPEPTPAHTPSPTQPSPTQPSPTQPSPTQPSPTHPSPTQPSPTQPGTEHHIPTPHDLPLHVVHSYGSDEGSLKLIELTNLVIKLSERIRVLEDDLKKTKQTYNVAVWDFNQHIESVDLKHGSERMKSPEKIKEEDVDTQKEMKEVSKESGAKRNKSLLRKRRTVKRQKGDGSSKNYKVLSEMLEDFDRQDVEELYRLVKERYSASRPEGYDLMLWGDLHTLFERLKESSAKEEA